MIILTMAALALIATMGLVVLGLMAWAVGDDSQWVE